MHVDDEGDAEGEVYVMQDDLPDDEALEILAAENDEDAILVMQFEDSIADTIQADSELCAYYSAYQEARRRLSERVKGRGFWPVSKRFDKGSGKKGKGKGKGRSPFSGSGSLARRIANSFCRICMQKGHWKNECPQRTQGSGATSTNASSSSVPTSFVIAEETPVEIAHIAMAETQDTDVHSCFMVQSGNNWNGKHNGDRYRLKGKQFASRFAVQWRRTLRTLKSSDPHSVGSNTEPEHPELPKSASVSCDSPESFLEANFVTTGTVGIIDLGASQTVIGDKQVPELLQQLPQDIKAQVKRTSCNLTFRFGNQQTLTCQHALLLPLGKAQFRIAIVPGRTPFLLSSSFLQGIKAIIDTEHGSLWSKLLDRELVVERNHKNLLMMDLNQLWCSQSHGQQAQTPSISGLIFQSEDVEKQEPVSSQGEEPLPREGFHDKVSMPQQDHSPKVHNASMLSPEATMSKPSMNVPPSASFDGVQDSASVTAVTVSQHVQHCPKAADISREPEDLRWSGRDRQDQNDDARAVVPREDQFREGQTGPKLSQGVPRPCLDGLVCADVRKEHEAGSPDVHSVRREMPAS